MRGRLCADSLRIDHVDLIVNHAIVDRIFDEGSRIRRAPKQLEIALVFSEEQFVGAVAE